MGLVILIVVAVVLFYLIVILGILLLCWKYYINKEMKKREFQETSNHMPVFQIEIDEVKKTLLGIKIEGVIKGPRPLYSNIIYYNEGKKHLPGYVYYTKQKGHSIYLRIFGIKASNVSIDGIFTNQRNPEQIRNSKNESAQIQFPLVIKPRIKLLADQIFLAVIAIFEIFLGVAGLILQSGFIGPIIFILIGCLLGYSVVLKLKEYFKNRITLQQNGDFIYQKENYNIKDLTYDISSDQEGILEIKFKDVKNQVVLTISERYTHFNELHSYIMELTRIQRKQKSYHYIMNHSFYLPFGKLGYMITTKENTTIMNLFETYQLSKSFYHEEAINYKKITLLEAIEMSDDFEEVDMIHIYEEDEITVHEIDEDLWKEILEVYQ